MNILFIGNGFDLEHEGMPKILHKDFVYFLRNKSKSYKLKFSDSNYKQFALSDGSLWSEFENFCNSLTDYKSKCRFYNKLSEYFNEWIDSLDINYDNFTKSSLIELLFNKYKFDSIFSFNYTDTCKKYNYVPYFFKYNSKKSEWKLTNFSKKYINLHRYNQGKKYKYILGSDEEDEYNKDWIIQKWDGQKKFNPKKMFLMK